VAECTKLGHVYGKIVGPELGGYEKEFGIWTHHREVHRPLSEAKLAAENAEGELKL